MPTHKAKIRGTSTYLQHRYPMPEEAAAFTEECTKAGLDPKKTSNVEASWYRDGEGACIPAEHIKQALVGAGKGEKVSGKGNSTWNNILKVAAAVAPELIPFTPPKKSYDFIHRAYSRVGSSRVLRERPAFETGWEAEFEIDVDTAEIDETNLRRFLERAGRRGIGDWRPERGGTCGRFEVAEFERSAEA